MRPQIGDVRYPSPISRVDGELLIQCVVHDDRRFSAIDAGPLLVAELRNQPLQKAFGCFGTPPCLDEDIKRISVRIRRPSEPEFPTVYRNENFVQMPFVGYGWPVSSNTICELAAKAVDPSSDGFPAEYHAALREQIFNICSTERKPVVDPDCIGDDLTRKTKTLQVRHFRRYLHA